MARGRWALLACSLLVSWLGPAGQARAADTWLEVKSPNFTVVTNAREGTGREVAWQFEQIRAAIAADWPWASKALDRPIRVVAAKDESSMKALLPQYWETRGSIHPSSVLITGADRHYIILRSDLKAEDTAQLNPYVDAYWAYSRLLLGDAFDDQLPLWFANGLAHVLSNTVVRETELRFGLPIPWFLRSLQQDSRLRLPALLGMDRTASYFRSPDTRSQFDAQSWGFVHFLMFGLGPNEGAKVNQLAALIVKGTDSESAVSQVYGALGPLENAYLLHSKKSIYQFSRVAADTKIQRRDFAVRTLSAGEGSAAQAGVYVATNRPKEARAAIAESRANGAAAIEGFEAEALLLEREGKTSEARAAFAKADELGSANFYTHLRLASAAWPQGNDAAALAQVEARARRSVAANDAFADAHTLLATALAGQAKYTDAMTVAAKALSLAPRAVGPRMAFAQVLWGLQRRDEAKAQARAALTLAQSEQQRAGVQQLIDFFEKASAGR